ncbi:hypothetical protein Hdeb2414_s0007g00237481 [Helianthus debilis subsp. tardiflorus]
MSSHFSYHFREIQQSSLRSSGGSRSSKCFRERKLQSLECFILKNHFTLDFFVKMAVNMFLCAQSVLIMDKCLCNLKVFVFC